MSRALHGFKPVSDPCKRPIQDARSALTLTIWRRLSPALTCGSTMLMVSIRGSPPEPVPAAFMAAAPRSHRGALGEGQAARRGQDERQLRLPPVHPLRPLLLPCVCRASKVDTAACHNDLGAMTSCEGLDALSIVATLSVRQHLLWS